MLHLQQHPDPHVGFYQKPILDWTSTSQLTGSLTNKHTEPLASRQPNIPARHSEYPPSSASSGGRPLSRGSFQDSQGSQSEYCERDGHSGQDMNVGHGIYSSSSDALQGTPSWPETRGHNAMAHVFSARQASSIASASRPTSRAPSPIQFEKPAGQDLGTAGRFSGHPAVAAYLHLPPEIAAGRPGSLAMFAAQAVLSSVESADVCPTPATRLVPEAKPSTGFLKWVTTILTTTQGTNVSQRTPSKPYELTRKQVLDDNTYTNKTWADVSGIPVYEIHVMEVEFLSHMKYNLYTSKEQWIRWYAQLNKFWTYCESASRSTFNDSPQPLSLRPSSLVNSYTLPSPPASTSASPAYASENPTNSTALSTRPYPAPQHMAPISVSPAGSSSESEYRGNERKRSLDAASYEPWPKRPHLNSSQRPGNSHTPSGLSNAAAVPSLPSLPFPTLPMPASQIPFDGHVTYTPHTAMSSQSYSQDGGITPSYASRGNWLNGVSSSTSLPSAQRRSMQPSSSQYNLYQDNTLPTPISAISYQSQYSSTPVTELPPYLDSNGDSHRLSPSHFLSKRSSPYRPVRNMSQLVQAPPSAHMSHYPAQVSHDQIQWQPLKKNVNENEIRNGRVPQLTSHNYYPNWWPATQQSDNSYPPYEPYHSSR